MFFANKAAKGKQQCNCLLAVYFWIQCYNRNRKKATQNEFCEFPFCFGKCLFWKQYGGCIYSSGLYNLAYSKCEFRTNMCHERIEIKTILTINLLSIWNLLHDYQFVVRNKKKAKMTSTFNERHLKIDLINQMSWKSAHSQQPKWLRQSIGFHCHWPSHRLLRSKIYWIRNT